MPLFNKIIPQEMATQFVAMQLPTLKNIAVANNAGISSGLAKTSADKLNDSIQVAYNKGYSAGYSQAEQDSQALLNARVTQLAPLLQSAHQELASLKSENAVRILELAMALAEQIVRAEVKINTAPLINVIRESVLLISDSVSRIELRIHPADVAMVKTETATIDTRITVIEDRLITQGGCRIITNQGEIDATLPARINAARLALGLEPVAVAENLEHVLSGNPIV